MQRYRVSAYAGQGWNLSPVVLLTGRLFSALVTLGATLREQGVGLLVTEQGLDTSTPEGRAMFGTLSVLAELHLVAG